MTAEAERFAAATGGEPWLTDQDWHRRSLASALMTAGLSVVGGGRRATDLEALDLFLEGYEKVRRPAGNTPFESAAVLAMLLGLQRGLIAEVDHLHQLFLSMKRERKLEEHVSFASGNEVDRMFIVVRPSLRDALMREGPRS